MAPYFLYNNKIIAVVVLMLSAIIPVSDDATTETTGIINGHFQKGTEFEGWSIQSHDDLLETQFSSSVVKKGERSLKLKYPDIEPTREYQDWIIENQGRLNVEPAQVWTASAWVKYEDTERIGLEIIALTDGEILSNWTSGYAAAYGKGDWELLESTAFIPPGCDQIYVRITGSGKTSAWIDDISLSEGEAQRTKAPRPKVVGWAYHKERIVDQLDRGLIALPQDNGNVYVRWRLREDDPEDIAFNLYRETGKNTPVKLNDAPIRTTTDFMDHSADLTQNNIYHVRSVLDDKEREVSKNFAVDANPDIKPYLSIKLDSDSTTAQKIGVGDLNGDGRMDYVIKTPNISMDPWYWQPTETTYTLEAYLSDGTFLWRKDLGQNIETGIWYSPYIVYDLNGNGRAEVAVKTGSKRKDYRETEPDIHNRYKPGRVIDGPEYISILDGMTGEETARADWPSRDGLGNYTHISRNLMGVAYLDGKTPSVVAFRGKYTISKLTTYQYYENELEEVWSWDSTDEPGGLYYGQGAHFMYSADVNGDGRDAIVMGAAVIDSNGDGLWSSGLGHPDNLWVGNIDPARPGLEIYFGIEGAREKGSVQNGISLFDALTGEMIWGLDQTTHHIHGSGLVSNIDSEHIGMEVYSGEQSYPNRWLHSAQGNLIADETTWNMGLSPKAVYWDARPEREVLNNNRIFRYPDETIADHIEGAQLAWADLMGDWREEIITSLPGELRIYLTTIPAADRRVTLMQDPLYRTGVAHFSMGYNVPPTTSYYIGRQKK